MRFLLVHKILNTSLDTKIIIESRSLCIFFPKMRIHKRYSDKTKCMYFIRKDEKLFDEHVITWKKS